jgi:hypothetical protein
MFCMIVMSPSMFNEMIKVSASILDHDGPSSELVGISNLPVSFTVR